MVVLCASCSPKPANVQNPGFEEGMVSWTATKGPEGSVTLSKDAAHGGEAGLRVVDPNETDFLRVEAERIRAVPGKTYRLTFWSNQVDGHTANVHFFFLDMNGERIEPRVIRGAVEGTTGWKEFEIVAKAPENASEIAIDIQSNRVGVGTVDFDDFAISELD